ncbi:cysteine proteinase falcipain 1, putative [Plasmodium gallinaceum]|uniref:Cysteine proteinase falcipain 1, putative n=2 Tax=Plasmodium gallinaceum TaxID=5849 RepID=A0A1J1GQS7_PLAGA|nr:cysteine proteinase falcipain 1, putative [Plasmodium gallinaceum]CRG94776.1 cysteine proteinase falcipain 1, putative [Plasmodium gallinaceum]
MKKEINNHTLSRRGLESLSKKKEHFKNEEKKVFRIYIYALITFIICSLILLYFTNNSIESHDLIFNSDEIEIFKDLLKRYKEENSLKNDEKIENDYNSNDLQKKKVNKNIIIDDLYNLIDEKNNISKERLFEILDDLLQKKFSKKNEKEEYILLNGIAKKNDNNLYREYDKNEELYDSKALVNLYSNLKYVSKFYEFMNEHNKNYNSMKEKIEKYENFKINYLEIKKHNTENHLYKKKVNKFSDYSKKELENYFKKLVPVPSHLIEKHVKPFSTILKSVKGIEEKEKNKDLFSTFPTNLDYREKGIVHEPKDQGVCGSCWAFAGVGNIESMYAYKNKKMISLSEQEVIDCSKKCFGCDGCHPFYAFLYALENKICFEEQYEYKIMENIFCLNYRCTNKVSLTSIGSVKENELIEALNKVGPLSVCVGASDDFVFYHEGIFDGICTKEVNHAVLLVGYGQVEKNKNLQKYKGSFSDEDDNFIYYWIIKNSWGSNWGENGFMRIIRNKNGDNLFCGIGKDVFYPVL